MRGNRTMDRSISYFLWRQTQEKCYCSPVSLLSFLPLDLEFGCLVVYLDSFSRLPIPLGRRRRCSRWSDGVRAQPVSDESSAWRRRFQALLPRTDICSAEPLQPFPAGLERADVEKRNLRELERKTVKGQSHFLCFCCRTNNVI